MRLSLLIYILFCLFQLSYAQDMVTIDMQNKEEVDIEIHNLNIPGHYFGKDLGHTTRQQPIVKASIIPERLPMFCALEKKLWDASKVWIKIRLPERDPLNTR